MKSIAVFCGASIGFDKEFARQARLLGECLAQNNIEVVYGGAKLGLMGAVADGALSQNGRVIGVIPHFLNDREVAHDNLTEMHFVDSMHDRKMKMNELSEGVITLPGGFGTMEEFFEMLTWAQLGLHQKPVAILNINSYYDHLVSLIDSMVELGFLKQINRDMLLIDDDINRLLTSMKNYEAPSVRKWITPDTI